MTRPDNEGKASDSASAPVADARAQNWVDRYAPAWALPYLRLARVDRPVGFYLLALPCFWSVGLAGIHTSAVYPDLRLLMLFAIGAIAMRGAGCTYNDIVDRDIDAKVARTRSRPIPSGQVSLSSAVVFLVAQCLVGLTVLLSLNGFSIWLGFAVVPIVALYPFMKRVSHWPQAVLGLAFNWGALMGWAAVAGGLDWAPVALYVGSVAWTIGYDTIYAHQDREDDALIGM
ncbi:MAG: 4-hydroxybenzoate octaprenyltransferase, partial [Methyloceanibacter sp.]